MATTTRSTTSQRHLLDRVPTQRGSAADDGRMRRRRWPLWIVAGAATTVALVVSAVVRADAAVLEQARHERVDQSVSATTTDLALTTNLQEVAVSRTATTQRVAVESAAQTALTQAVAAAAASTHAGDALTALNQSIEQLRGELASGTVTPADLRSQMLVISATQTSAIDSETKWRTERARRVAAEAAARAARSGSSGTTTTSSRSTSGSGSSGTATTGGSIYPVTLRCTDASGSGTLFSSAALGAAINDWRAAQGLPALSIRTGLTTHSLNMAASGGIWHSGQDNIVGCAGSATSLVNAWANSPSHRAQMVRTNVSSMTVGAATSGRFLYGAVRFS